MAHEAITMNRVLTGIVRGKTIEFPEELGVDDGRIVKVILRRATVSGRDGRRGSEGIRRASQPRVEPTARGTAVD